jgi:hypothetical protein
MMPLYEAKWGDDKFAHVLHISAATPDDAVYIAKFHARDTGATSMSLYVEAQPASYMQFLCNVDLDGEESE